MGEVRFSFSGAEIVGRLSYAREPDQGGKLSVEFSSTRLVHQDLRAKRFSLSFNNIGEADPLGLLESLDQGYLDDKVTGLPVSRHDLFETITRVRQLLDEEAQDLKPDQIRAAEGAIDLAASRFDGDHRASSEELIRALRRTGVGCFQDDPFHLIGSRRTHENRVFERFVWPALIEAIEDHLCASPDLDAAIEAIVAGESLPTADEDDRSEPDPGF
jgi:hypothetical protein